MSLAWWGNVGNPAGSSNQPLNVAKARIMVGIFLDDKALFQSGYDHLMNTLHKPRHLDPGLAGAEIVWPDWSPIDKEESLNLFELSVDINGEYTEVNRTPAPNGHVAMDEESLNHIIEVLCHQGYDLYGETVTYNTGNGAPDMTDAKPRHLLSQEWFADGATGEFTMTLHPSKGLAPWRAANLEQAYNHYKYRSTEKYDLSKLEEVILAQRENGENRLITTVLYSELDKTLLRKDCSWGGSGLTPPECPDSQDLCSLDCVDLKTDSNNCGSCGTACSGGSTCADGVCSCAPDQKACGDECVDTASSGAHCGSCGAPCSANELCSLGTCSSSCAAGLIQCGQDCVSAASCEEESGTNADGGHAGAPAGSVSDSSASAGGCACSAEGDGPLPLGWTALFGGLGLIAFRRRMSTPSRP